MPDLLCREVAHYYFKERTRGEPRRPPEPVQEALREKRGAEGARPEDNPGLRDQARAIWWRGEAGLINEREFELKRRALGGPLRAEAAESVMKRRRLLGAVLGGGRLLLAGSGSTSGRRASP